MADYAWLILSFIIGLNLGFMLGAWFCQHQAKRRGYRNWRDLR